MEITQEQIKKIIELSGAEVFVENVDSTILSRMLVLIEQKMNFFDIPIELNSQQKFNVLIVDDLELSIYQFTKALKKIGVSPVVARNKEEALAEIKKSKFDYIITDLYLPDFRDGMSIIDEVSKLKALGEQNCKIIVISSTNNQAIIDSCLEKADKYITKNEKWHEEILRYIAQNIKQDDAEVANFSKYFVNDNDIAVYTLIKINTQKYVKEFIDEINLTVAKGTKKIIVNFEKVNFFDAEYAFLFTELFKTVNSAGGSLIFVSINKSIKLILDDIYITEILQLEDSLDKAIESLTQEN